MIYDKSEATMQRFSAAVVGDSRSQNWFFRYDGPTLLVAVAIYASWVLLLWFHQSIPWYVMAPVAGYIVQWHFSLQHEAIHSFRGLPKWLRTAIVWPPIGGWFPFELYRRSHSQHHRNTHLTFPGEDTETYYHEEEDWEDYGPLWHWLYTVNQTLLGRVLLGPFLRTPRLYANEIRKIARKDYSNVWIWIRHFIGVGLIFVLVSQVFGMPIWQYLIEFIYTGMMFGMVRTFIEHRWGERPSERTAVVESNWLFGLLFLWNNLHAVHHTFPTLAWYRVPRVWREYRARIIEHNGGYVFRGYAEIARRWLLQPVFMPVHPPSRRAGQARAA
jgi:fatty acid desaturase